MKKSIPIAVLLGSGIFAMSLLSACATVKPYQKNKLNDSEMALSSRTAQKFEQSFQLYREGGSGANGGKSGGGCGCN
ncbi:DUF4266 domain-containing protein [Pedobacter cryoconitis]|uniref:Uncharacterized protein DUF4266 n=1 Tax=Pedobacter cryoconitis TaxID=188932 RepID=A0A327S4Y2_9SPHI|nr:DUF4266 domain-containing protein [Pedobacter cryoconitis]MBB5638335.1 hypothetical protein [Pedobacter cryoconitis]MBB5645803.1 hypothetical protein [Pedobacter cryoconitis]RAJ22633.1 uncharacterized protein DUF4266 [Pedobacter cryoconitis]